MHLQFLLMLKKNTMGLCPKSLNNFLEKNCEIREDGYCRNKKTNNKIIACLPVNLFGHPCNAKLINNICSKFNINLIEDSAEALGLTYKNKPCGSFGDASVFSFYANKHITTGEGGMIVTNNKYIANKCKSLRNICFNKHRRFIHYDLGWNYRFTNLQAAVGLAQLEKLDFFVKKKRNIGKIYNKSLGDGQSYLLPVNKKSYGENIYWVYGILLKNSKISVKKLMSLLRKKGIETRNFFWPLHQQPILKKMGYFKNTKLPIAEYLGKNGLYLPTGLSLKLSQQNYVIRELKKILK